VALIDLLQPLLNKVKAALGPFGRMFDILGSAWQRTVDLKTNVTKLVNSILAEIAAWRNFKEDIAFRTRVINLPNAIDKTQEFLAQIRSGWDAIVALWNDLRGKLDLGGGNPTEEAEQAIKDIENSGFRDFFAKFPNLLKGAEKVLGFVVILGDALTSLLDAIDDLQRIVDTVKAIREEVETGSTIFLQNKNPRRTLKLADGGSIKIRVGNLHS